MAKYRTAKTRHKWKTVDTWTPLLGGISRSSSESKVTTMYNIQRYKMGWIKFVHNTTPCAPRRGWRYCSQNNVTNVTKRGEYNLFTPHCGWLCATTGIHRRHVCAFHAKRVDSQFQQPTWLRFPSVSSNILLQWRTGFEQTENNFTHR
jgi:hypothetical protein